MPFRGGAWNWVNLEVVCSDKCEAAGKDMIREERKGGLTQNLFAN
jgi:hypothetical protein